MAVGLPEAGLLLGASSVLAGQSVQPGCPCCFFGKGGKGSPVLQGQSSCRALAGGARAAWKPVASQCCKARWWACGMGVRSQAVPCWGPA